MYSLQRNEREGYNLETKEHFNKRMVARVRRIVKETEQYKTDLLRALCEQNGIIIQANNRRVVNTDYLISRIEDEDIPFTFKYSANKTYVFGDLLVSLVEIPSYSYFVVSLKPPVFDLEGWVSHYEPLESFLNGFESKCNR